MADNVSITPGTGAVIAADEVGGVLVQVVKLAVGGDGFATMIDAANPVPVSAPASLRTTHSISVTHAVDALMSGTTAVPVKFARGNIAASTTDSILVGAVASKVLLVLEFRVFCGGVATTVAFNSKPAGAGVSISETFALGANQGFNAGYSPVGHFKTVSAEGLSVTTGAGSTVGVGVAYVEV